MTSRSGSVQPLTPSEMEARLRALARALLGGFGVDDLEMRHLLEILTRTSHIVAADYDSGTLEAVMSRERAPAALLEPVFRGSGELLEERLSRVLSVPDMLRHCGDKCLYDVGLAGRTRYRGIDLKDLGPRSYSLASEVLSLLADDRKLREFFDLNLLEKLPIDEEILFLRQCASRFKVYAQILQAFRAEDPGGEGPSAKPEEARIGAPARASSEAAASVPATVTRMDAGSPGPESAAAGASAAAGEEDLKGLDREERLAQYERSLMLSSLDLPAVRKRMKEVVIDQDETVDQLCDDLTVFALGTRDRPRPQSYLLVGPTGVGKNYLIETLVRLLEEVWRTEVPFLLVEGPQFTYPSDVGELKGSTRGFIRSDEEGLLAEFNSRARYAPLSVLLVDEVEKAHPQLARFFLSLMDRGTTMDNKGRTLRFPATILAYTSNIGYSEEQMRGEAIGYSGTRSPGARRSSASTNLKRTLPPEFLNRLKVLHFSPLSPASAVRILDLELRRIVEKYRTLHGIDLRVSEAAREALVARGFSPEYGARHLVCQVDRVCNVEVGIRLRDRPVTLSAAGLELLDRIRAARGGSRAIDEAEVRAGLARETRAARDGTVVTVDTDGDRFVYRIEAA